MSAIAESFDKSELLNLGIGLVKNRDYKAAHDCLKVAYQNGLKSNSHSPLLKSYYGFTLAMVEGNVRDGTNLMNAALAEEIFIPDIYLNLGRFFLEREKDRKKALNAF